MRLRSVNILGKKFKIVKKIPDNVAAYSAEGAIYGHCNRETCEIWINPRCNFEHFYRTLFHEMGHGLMSRNGVCYSGAIPHELEEILVETFASMQYEFLCQYFKKLLQLSDTEVRETLRNFK